MHYINKEYQAADGDRAGGASNRADLDPDYICRVFSGLPGTQYEAERTVDTILDRIDPERDLGDQVAEYTLKLTASERRAFLTMARQRARLKAGFAR